MWHAFPVSLALLAAVPAPGPTPEGLFRDAALDLATAVRPDQRPSTRYLSLHGIPEADRAAFRRALTFAVNSAATRTNLVTLPPIGDGHLLRVDLEALGWDRPARERTLRTLAELGVVLRFRDESTRQRYIDIWESFADLDPFLGARLDPADPRLARWVAHASGSCGPVVSAHWLYPRLMLEAQDGGFYSQLNFHPPLEADLYRRLGVDLRFLDRVESSKHGGAVVRSVVAYHPRELQELPSSTGYDVRAMWITFDFIDASRARTNVLESLAGTAVHDGREIIYTKANGLHGYYLANGKGVQVNVVPQAIAEDQRVAVVDPASGEATPSIVNRSVITSYKCVSCHGEASGIIPFVDRVSRLLLIDQDTQGRLPEGVRDYYRSGLPEKVRAQQQSYAARVQACNGLDPAANARQVVGWFDRLTNDLVTTEQAAREIGRPLPVARVLWQASGQLQLTYLAVGEPILRARWERLAGDSHGNYKGN